jgi:hypothetical protein
MAGGLEDGPVSTVEGESFAYHLTPAGTGWYLRTKEAAQKDNPLADRWLTIPERDAHVIVIAEEVEAGEVDMDRFAGVVVENARRGASSFELVGQWPLGASSRLLQTRSTVNGVQVQNYYGLYARAPYIYQVIAFTTDGNFDAMAEDLKQTVQSFEID